LSASSRHIALIIPGLCGPVSDTPVSDFLRDRPVALDRLLSRSQRDSVVGKEPGAALCRWFDLEPDASGQLPVAPLTLLADTGQAGSACILRADPVHLRADQSCLRLFDSHTFSITQDEADELVAAFNSFYAETGWLLTAPRPQRWYLSLPNVESLNTLSPAQVAGRDINPCLPQGASAAGWHSVMNEVQMLFHEHPVNAARAERGEPVINSVWFWGGGMLPQALQTTVSRMVTDHPLAMGLAQQAGIPRLDLPASAQQLLALAGDGLTLVFNDGLEWAAQYSDIDSWVEMLRKLEHDWFAPLLAATRQGAIASLVIEPCNESSYRSTRRQQQCFWKRIRPFETVCHNV
jgi:hypothetical protein